MDKIGSYNQLTEFTNAGAGTSEWCKASKDGKTYFIKMFLNPVYPAEEAGLSGKRHAAKLKRFHETLETKENMYGKLRANDSFGVMVVPEEVFSFHYHIVTASEYILGNVPHSAVFQLSSWQKTVILRTLTKALMDVHSAGYVHSDMKPDNILFSQDREGNCRIHLIDFDSCFPRDNPPTDGDKIIGDPAFFAPEEYDLSRGKEVVLDEKVDIFALGIIFHYLWCGEFPVRDSESAVGELLQSGEHVGLNPAIPLELRKMIMRMLRVNPAERANCQEIYDGLGELMATFPIEKYKILPEPDVKPPKHSDVNVRVDSRKEDPGTKGASSAPEETRAVIRGITEDDWVLFERSFGVPVGRGFHLDAPPMEGYSVVGNKTTYDTIESADLSPVYEFVYKKKEKKQELRSPVLGMIAAAALVVLSFFYTLNWRAAVNSALNQNYAEAQRRLNMLPGIELICPEFCEANRDMLSLQK